jgi:hypothetical protein
MEIVGFGDGLNAAPMSTRHDFVFATRHPNHEGFTQQYF